MIAAVVMFVVADTAARIIPTVARVTRILAALGVIRVLKSMLLLVLVRVVALRHVATLMMLTVVIGGALVIWSLIVAIRLLSRVVRLVFFNACCWLGSVRCTRYTTACGRCRSCVACWLRSEASAGWRTTPKLPKVMPRERLGIENHTM